MTAFRRGCLKGGLLLNDKLSLFCRSNHRHLSGSPSSQPSRAVSSLRSSYSSNIGDCVQSQSSLLNQSRSSSDSTRESTSSWFSDLEQLTEEQLFHRLGYLRGINAELGRELRRMRPVFRPEDDVLRRVYRVDDKKAVNIALLVRCFGGGVVDSLLICC